MSQETLSLRIAKLASAQSINVRELNRLLDSAGLALTLKELAPPEEIAPSHSIITADMIDANSVPKRLVVFGEEAEIRSWDNDSLLLRWKRNGRTGATIIQKDRWTHVERSAPVSEPKA